MRVLFLLALPLLADDALTATATARPESQELVTLAKPVRDPGGSHPKERSAAFAHALPVWRPHGPVVPSVSAPPPVPDRHAWGKALHDAGRPELPSFKSDGTPAAEFVRVAEVTTSGAGEPRQATGMDVRLIVTEPAPPAVAEAEVDTPTPPSVILAGPRESRREPPWPFPLPRSGDELHQESGEPPLATDALLSELAEGIARATTQGALRLAVPRRDDASERPRSGMTVPAGANIRLRLPGEDGWLAGESPPESSCPSDSALDVAAWGPGKSDPDEAIAAIRASLSEDVDAVDEDRAVGLARLYVSLGFGAEARAVLDAMAPRRPETPLLLTVSYIIDGEAAPPGTLESFAGCPGRAQMWFTLGSGEQGDAKAVVAALSELPLPLRRHVGPPLMDVFLRSGDEATAESIRAAIERAAGPHGEDFALAAAQVDLGREKEAGLKTIRDIALTPSPTSDEALAVLLEAAHDRGEIVDEALVVLAGTRADDLRGTPEGTRLLTGLIQALVRRDAFDAAALRLASARLPSETTARLATEFFAALAERGSDDAVLVHGAGLSATLGEFVRITPAGPAIATRLLDLGLPDVARNYLPQSPSDPAVVFLTARMKLLAGSPHEALALLDGLSDATADQRRLQAEALWSTGRVEEAASIRRELDGADVVREDAAGASVIASPVEPAGSSPRDIVVASEAVRQQIDALLAAAPSP